MKIAGVTIRQATAADVGRLADCWRAMVDEVGMAPGGFQPDWRERLERFLATSIASEAHGWFVSVTPDGSIVATAGAVMSEVSLIQNDRIATVAGVYVEPPFRRRGLARELTLRAIGWARDHGCKLVRLTASEPAERLYRELGFTQGRELLLRLS